MPDKWSGSEIAIVGMAGRFPGARNVSEFWENLRGGVESIRRLSPGELDSRGVPRATSRDPRFVPAVAEPEGVDLFDAGFFDMTAKEAALVDPQHRMLLEVAWQALEDAGYDSETYDGAVGVYAGATINTYLLFNLRSRPEITDRLDLAQINIANGGDFLTTRVSYKLNLNGPSHLVQSACSTSLVAVHVARQSLLDEQCDIALAGGVSVNVRVASGYKHLEGGMVSPDGHCRAFDAKAEGTIFGGGSGVVVLKRLEDALADGDSIRAVIRGAAINNDGSCKVGYTAPSVEGQAAVITEALADAGVNAETIGYVEAHGTATALGDPIEVRALQKAFRAHTEKLGFCPIGSVKSNIGHLDAAAGVTSLIKTVLALEHEEIPPSLHYDTPNPNIDFEKTPFHVCSELTPWRRSARPRRAGVSAFGVGGTNAHLVLEEAPVPLSGEEARDWQLLPISAKSEEALEDAVENLSRFLSEVRPSDLADVAYTLSVGRRGFDHRAAVVCRTVRDAVEALDLRELAVATEDAEPVFLLPGVGSPTLELAELYRGEAIFRRHLDEVDAVLARQIGLHLGPVLGTRDFDPVEFSARLRSEQLQQVVLFAVEVALARFWMSWGLEPKAIWGQGVGEIAAAHLADALPLDDALRLAWLRGRLTETQADGSVLSVGLSEAELGPLVPPEAQLLSVLGPSLCQVTGPATSVALFLERLTESGVPASLASPVSSTQVVAAFGPAESQAALALFASDGIELTPRTPRVPCMASTGSSWLSDQQVGDSDYWAGQFCQIDRPAASLAALLDDERRLLLEVGPGAACIASDWFQQMDCGGRMVLSSFEASCGDSSAPLLATLGRLWKAGAAIDWPRFYSDQERLRVPLPTYPFQRQRFWIEALQESSAQAAGAVSVGDVAGSPRLPRPELGSPFVPPSGPLECSVASIWEEALGLEQVGVMDSFFDLGGDSLVALQVMEQIQLELGIEVPAVTLYEELTIRALVQMVSTEEAADAENAPPVTAESRNERVQQRKRYQRERARLQRERKHERREVTWQ